MPTDRLVLLAALLAGTLGLQSPAAGAGLAVTVTGPVTGGQRGEPFSAPTVELDGHGYVAEEFFLDGSASTYRLAADSEHGADGQWQTEKETDSVPYRTRILVVRPADASGFNGTVIVHWQNVTAGFELGSVSGGEVLRGYAWVGVSAQSVGVNGFPGPQAAGLRQWDAERYGSLDHPGDAYSYDIFSQAGRVVGPDRPQSAGDPDPMGGLRVERLIAAGASQSASRLRTYINGVHPIEKVFDGYIPYIDFASPVPFAADRSGNRRGNRTPTTIRVDLGVPVFVVNSETETLAYFRARQPDTDTFRFWEVPGTSHVSVARDAVATTEGMESPNWLSYTPVYNAALRHMHVWLAAGTPPPAMPPIETAGDGSVAIRRDARGNALGGVRLPELAVPSSEHRGTGTRVEGGSRFAFLYGYSREFTAQELAELYPGQDAFMAKYGAALEAAVKAGVVLAEEAPEMRRVAETWAGKSLPTG